MAKVQRAIPYQVIPGGDYPRLRYGATLEYLRDRWYGIEAIGALEAPISGDDIARLRNARTVAASSSPL